MGQSAQDVGTLGGGIIGGIAAGPDRGHAQALIDQATGAYNINLPSDIANAINLQQYTSAGQLTPAQEQAITAQSQAAQVKANPQLVNAQMQALNQLKNASQTGMTSADKARYNQMQQQLATQQEGQRQQVMQNFAQRGQAGSGNELLAQLQASQNAANQANQQGLGIAGQAQQNALNALSQYGGQAGGMEQQQFGQQSQAANAADLMNRFNVGNQVSQQARNVGGQNAAQQYNLQNAQNIGNANTSQANQELLRQKNAQQQLYQDALQRAQGISGTAFTGAADYNSLAGQKAQQWTNMGQGIGKLAGGSDVTSMFGGGGGGGGAGGSADSASGIMPAGGSNFLQSGIGLADGGMVNQYMTGGMVSGYADGGDVEGIDPNLSTSIPNTFLASEENTPSVNTAPTSSPMLKNEVAPTKDSSGGGGGGGGLMSMLPMLAMLAAEGGKVPGKAKVDGDSYKNDTIPAMLSANEVVIPRSITQSPNAGPLAKLFVEGELKKSK